MASRDAPPGPDSLGKGGVNGREGVIAEEGGLRGRRGGSHRGSAMEVREERREAMSTSASSCMRGVLDKS
jgi:hypothetical protein